MTEVISPVEEAQVIMVPELPPPVVRRRAVNEAIPEDQRQPTRTGRAETTREFDQTFLDPNTQVVHRDYAAHFFRWGFAKKNFIKHEQTSVLDVGCGPDRPLLLVLFGGIGPSPLAKRYVGVDLSKIKTTAHARSTLYPEFNYIKDYRKLIKAEGQFDLITNFEVIEHMSMDMGLQLLRAMKAALAPGGRILLSTPVYDGIARAANHIREYTIPELEAHVKKAGLEVVKRYGTFANVIPLRKALAPHQLQTFKELQEYYGNDVLSTFLAPLYPDESRNNLWVLRKKGDA